MWRCGKYLRRKKSYNGKRVQYKKGDHYFKDMNMDAMLYVEILEKKLLPRIQELRRLYWDDSNGCADYTITVQHDGAPGHRAEGIEQYLDNLFERVLAVFLRQPAQSPLTNLLDLCVFYSLSSKVSQTDYKTKEQLHGAVLEAFRDLAAETLDMEWAVKVAIDSLPCCLCASPPPGLPYKYMDNQPASRAVVLMGVVALVLVCCLVVVMAGHTDAAAR